MVLKPAELLPEEHRWQAALFDALPEAGFRVARPRRGHDGAVTIDGWCAWGWLAGRHEPLWRDIITVGERFHDALQTIPRPAFLDERRDPWAVGDRVAWGELPLASLLQKVAPFELGALAHLDRLMAALRPVEARSQLVHGDLGGNVLFEPGLPPAIIDFSPYWRPQAFAAAVVIADALTWEGADISILGGISRLTEFPQYLFRALIHRIVTEQMLRPTHRIEPTDGDPYRPVVDLACSLSDSWTKDRGPMSSGNANAATPEDRRV
ncbi:MAG: phosphotransferase [Candidatus Limnocylindrales bacterium]